MRNRIPCTVALLVAAAAAGACGGDGDAPGTGRSDPQALPGPADARPPSKRATPAAVPAADVENLLAALAAASGDAQFRRESIAAFVARGAPALDALVAALRGNPTTERWAVASEILVAFGIDGQVAAATLTDLDAESVRRAVCDFLGARDNGWRDDVRGIEVARALLDALDRAGSEEAAGSITGVLASGCPAAAPLAAELATRFAAAATTHWTARYIADTLREWGTDAAGAAPVLAAALRAENDDLRDLAAEVLAEIGPAAPSVLPEILRSRDDLVVANILRSWGDAAAPAVQRLLRMLESEDESVQSAAGLTLLGVPSVAKEVWPAILTHDLNLWWTYDAKRLALADPVVARDVAAWMRSAPGEAFRAESELADAAPDVARQLAPDLLRSADAWGRSTGLALLVKTSPGDVSAAARQLLEDPDAGVRAHALRELLAAGGIDTESARQRALGMLGDEDAFVRAEALGVLAQAGPRTADGPLLVAALREDATRKAAVAALARLDGPFPADAAASAPSIAALAVEDWGIRGAALSILARIEGGDDALVAELRIRMERGWGRDVIEVVAAAGPRLRALAETVAARAELPEEPEVRGWQAARAAIAGDAAAALALRPNLLAELLPALLPTETGRRAIIVSAEDDVKDERVLDALRNDASFVATLRAAMVLDADSPDVEAMHLGSLRLLSVLPPEDRLPALARLALSAAPGVRSEATFGLQWEAPHGAATVPVATLAALLGSGDRDVRTAATVLAAHAGLRAGAVSVPLRSLLGDESPAVRANAALALGRAGGFTEDVMRILRDATVATIRDGGVDDNYVAWEVLAESSASVPLSDANLGAWLAGVRGADMHTTQTAFCALLVPYGSRAAAAVPDLRRALRTNRGMRSCMEPTLLVGPAEIEFTAAAARLLAAIGRAARAAIPDLQMAAAFTGDRHGAVREAIERLSASR